MFDKREISVHRDADNSDGLIICYRGYQISHVVGNLGESNSAPPADSGIPMDEWMQAWLFCMELEIDLFFGDSHKNQTNHNVPPLKYVDNQGRIQLVGHQPWYDYPPAAIYQ